MFGVDYKNTDQQSKITLGGYDKSVVPNDTSFAYVDLIDTFYWSVRHTESTYGSTPLDFTATRAILDTGTSLTYFPSSDFNRLWSEISKGKNCGFSSGSGFRACECEDEGDFEDITFHFGDFIFYFPASAYVTVNRRLIGENICELWIDELDFNLGQPSLLIGDSFLRNYYILHDAQSLRVGLFGKATADGMGYDISKWSLMTLVLLFTIYTLI